MIASPAELAFLNGNHHYLCGSPLGATSLLYKGGIVSYVDYLNRTTRDCETRSTFSAAKDDIEVEAAIQYNDSYAETTLSFANNNTHEGGTH